MKRAVGIGGIFFKSKNPEQLKQWYATHLGVPMDQHNCIVFDHTSSTGKTVFAPFSQETSYFEPSMSSFMFNFIVEDLDAVLEALKAEGVAVLPEVKSFDYGRFGWVIDPEGNKVELWQPA